MLLYAIGRQFSLGTYGQRAINNQKPGNCGEFRQDDEPKTVKWERAQDKSQKSGRGQKNETRAQPQAFSSD